MVVNKARVAQYRLRREIYKRVLRLRQNLSIRAYAFREAPLLREARRKYEKLYQEETEPLVSVTIATYNRAQILVERAVTSALNQTYRNLEVIVVGDGCTDDTAEQLAKIDDPRLRFINLPERGKYPANPKHRWMVAGTYPINRAQAEAKGSWIAHLDDDAIWELDHVEVMLREARARNLEMVYGLGYVESSPGVWENLGNKMEKGVLDPHSFMPHSSWVFRSYLTLFRLYSSTWRIDLGTDWHATHRMLFSGVRVGFYPCVAYRESLRQGTNRGSFLAEDRI